MSRLLTRHQELARELVQTDPERAVLHSRAAVLHRTAHVSPYAMERAMMATTMAFDGWNEGDHPRGEGGQFGVGTHVKINSPGIRGHGESGHILSSRDGHYQVQSGPNEHTNYMARHENVKPTGKPPAKGSPAEKAAKEKAEQSTHSAKTLTPTDHAHNADFKTEGKITHRAGKFTVHQSPVRTGKGLPGHGVFEDDNAKAHGAYHTHEEARGEAERLHAESKKPGWA